MTDFSADELRLIAAALSLLARQRGVDGARRAEVHEAVTLAARCLTLDAGAPVACASASGVNAPPPSSPLMEMMRTAEVAAALGVTGTRVRQLAASLGGRKPWGDWVFDRAAVEEYMKNRPATRSV